MQLEKKIGKPVDNELLNWFEKNGISASDILFIIDRMSPVQVRNYLKKQNMHFNNSYKETLTTWQDYLAMAEMFIDILCVQMDGIPM